MAEGECQRTTLTKGTGGIFLGNPVLPCLGNLVIHDETNQSRTREMKIEKNNKSKSKTD